MTAATAIAMCVPLLAAVKQSQSFERTLPLSLSGSLTLRNPAGSIEVVGVDDGGVRFVAKKTLTGRDKEALAVADRVVQLQDNATADGRIAQIATVAPAMIGRDARGELLWRAEVSYTIWMPRSADLTIVSDRSGQIRVSNMIGSVFVRNVTGNVVLQKVRGATTVESANGSIAFIPEARPLANVSLSTINGAIEVTVPPESRFLWIADVLIGDYRTSFANVRGRLVGSAFHGAVNGQSGPTIRTTAVTGSVLLVSAAAEKAKAKPVRELLASRTEAPNPAQQASRRNLNEPLVEQAEFTYATNIGDIGIKELRGNAILSTGAGVVRLGTVTGTCRVTSNGGPLELGDIFGALNARTAAGDVTIQAARSGGFVHTGGGIIRLLYTNGPTTLYSGGGDIHVRLTTSPVSAETRSGDVLINVAPNVKSQKMLARTAKGNIVLSLPGNFGADVDAMILTSDAEANRIQSEFPGLTINREQVGNGKTRIRATGKINGGGERIELYAENGSIQLTSRSGKPRS